MGNRENSRGTVYILVGGYLMYLAYQLFGVRADYEGSKAVMMIGFAVFFLIVGAAILCLAIYMYYKAWKKSNQEEEAEEKGGNEDVYGK